MCGIWCTILASDGQDSSKCGVCSGEEIDKLLRDQFVEMLSLHKNRGPDISTPTPAKCIPLDKAHIQLSGHVLWTQGSAPVPQPYIHHSSNDSEPSYQLLFNGDIYEENCQRLESRLDNDTLGDAALSNFAPDQLNDGLQLFKTLTRPRPWIQGPKGEFLHGDKFGVDLDSTLSAVRGPYAFILVVSTPTFNNAQVWFGRDFFGRQSLLFSTDSAGNFHISSVSVFESVFEIPAAGFFRLDMSSRTMTLFPSISSKIRVEVNRNLQEFTRFLKDSCNLTLLNAEKSGMRTALWFNTRLTPWIDDASGAGMPPEQKVVFLELLQLAELKKSLTPGEILEKAVIILEPLVDKFLTLLRNSVKLRIQAVAPYCKNCVRNLLDPSPCGHSRVGVLFSGGLDSTVLSYLAIEVLEKVDLLSVAFSKDDDFSVPDRLTAVASHAMLQDIFPKKTINLVLVNQTKEDVQELRSSRIKTLISPLKSVIDDSVGCCLWFAARGAGLSSVRTVLLGSGADELLGGYSRHRSAFQGRGWTGLTAEMQLDLDRISSRNMGRDNRVIADHGLSPRMPYLDERLVHWLTQEVPVWAKCCPLLGDGERGLGEKILLRAAAYKLFGAEYAEIALFPKRAMQFGSRIAKLENSKEKGAQNCDRLL